MHAFDEKFSQVSSKTENGTSDPFGSEFTVTSSADDSSSNPFMDISSADTQSSSANPLYDMSTTDTSTSQSANPLYDLMDDDFSGQPAQQTESQSANPLYDLSENDANDNFTFETTVTTTTTVEDNPSANPLYDFTEQEVVVQEESAGDNLEVDFGTGGVMEKSTPSEDILVQANNGFQVEDQVVPEVTQQQETGPREVMEEEEEEQRETVEQSYQPQQEEEEEAGGQSFDQNVELYIREEGEEEQPVVADAGGVAAAVDVDVDVADGGDDDDADSTKGRRRSRSRSPSRSRSRSISSEREVVNEFVNEKLAVEVL
nr:hypothetical protein BaRGS_034551 [Batillaria attramentaria]